MHFHQKVSLLCFIAILLASIPCSSVQQTNVERGEIEQTKSGSDSDTAAREMMIGTWILETDLVRGHTTLFPDGRFEARVPVFTSKGKEDLQIKGTWKVENGKYIEAVRETNRPDLLPPGTTSTDEISSVRPNEIILIGPMGIKCVFYREKPENPLFTELAVKSGLSGRLPVITASAVSDIEHEWDLMDPAQQPPPEMRSLLRSLRAEAFSVERVQETFLREIEIRMSPDEILAVTKWYDSPLGRKSRELELAAIGPEAQKEMKVYISNLRQSPPPPERLALVQKLDSACKLTETSVRLHIARDLAVIRGKMPLLPPEKEKPLMEAAEDLERQRPGLEVRFQPRIVGSWLYKFRSLSDAELREYVDFWTTDMGIKYEGVFWDAFLKAWCEGEVRYYRCIDFVLKNSKDRSGA